MDAKQFLTEFGHIVNAPEGIDHLRNLILGLAFRGELTENIASSENKSLDETLLIAKKNGKRLKKNDKGLLEIKESANLFNIPANWNWQVLGNIGFIFNGNSISKPARENIYSNVKSGLPFISTPDVPFDRNQINYQSGLRIPYEETESKFKVTKKGSVLVCSEGGSAGRKVGITDRDICFGNKLYAIEVYAPLFAPYVYNYYKSEYFRSQFNDLMTGIIGGVSLKRFQTISIPVPPIEVQKRIVTKVDELMALCDKLEVQQQKRRKLQTLTRTTALDALANAQSPHQLKDAWQRVQDNMLMLLNGDKDIDTFKNTLLKLAVRGLLNEYSSDEVLLDDAISTTDAMRASYVEMKWLQKQKSVGHIDTEEGYYPSHWMITPFDAIAIVIGGVTKGRTLKDRETAFFPYLRVANVQRGYFNLIQMKEIEIPIEEFEKYQLMDGDLLITEGGDWDKVGRTAIWHKNIAKCLHQNHIFKARIPSNQILNEWVELVFNSEIGRAYFAGASKQTTNLASINMTQLRSFPFPVPPVSEQKEIIRKISGLLDICKLLDSYNKRKNNIAFLYSYSAIASMTGFQIKEDEQMKVPKTELISKLKLKVSPNNKDQAPLSAILAKHNGELSSKALWNYSGMKIDEFYQQLKTEMARDWIVEPEKARMIEKDADNQSGAEAG